MTNEPKAGGGLDPEMLASYIDKRLPPDERAAVEAKLATDPDSYELLVELIHANEALKDERPREEDATVPTAPRLRTWAIAGGVLAAAAAVALVVGMQPDWLLRLRGGDAVDPRLAQLVTAVGEERYIEARLTGGFKYGPRISRQRSGSFIPASDWALVGVVKELEGRQSWNERHALGAGYLLLGRVDDSIAVLAQVVAKDDRKASAAADYAAAVTERALSTRDQSHLNEATLAVNTALRLNPGMPEALFNRALILAALADPGAKAAWQDFLLTEPAGPWSDLARRQMNGIDRRE